VNLFRIAIRIALHTPEVEKRAKILKPAFTKLVNYLNENPEVLSEQSGVEELQQMFGIKRTGQIPSLADVNKEITRFENMFREGYVEGYDDAGKLDIAKNWVNNVDDKIEYFEQKIKKIHKSRPIGKKPEGKTWGRYLFAPARHDVPFEENTEDEQKAYEAIWDMLFENTPIPNDVANQILKLISNGEYRNFLAPPNVNQFYRGMSNISTKHLSKWLGEAPKGNREKDVSMVFSPKGSGSSWTIKEEVTAAYTNETKDGNWSIVMTAPKSGNKFIFNPKTLYKIGDFAGSDSHDNASSHEVFCSRTSKNISYQILAIMNS
jgi:hypothetical protein